ncbi:MAG: hypothetical protein QG641_2797 [Candidatus Poribacteria bacterium]|nr:hypothetical protein [Candidatus Poribacteria bacterium]
MRLIQFKIPPVVILRVGLVEGDSVFDLTNLNPFWDNIYSIFIEARKANKTLEEFIDSSKFRQYCRTMNYSELLKNRPGDEGGWILPPINHPDPSDCMVTGTGLTHLGSMSQRDKMHKSHSAVQQKNRDEVKQKTDSQKMFEMGLEGGKPEYGKRGIAPEWFYKGNGLILRGYNDYLDIPSFSEDGGEEPEIVGCYIIGKDGVPYRLGFAIANEWSDHITERVNYLWLAPSKLRTCSIGPELITDQSFKDIRGYCRIYRGNDMLYDSGELLTGEDNMSHSLANLEDHHFKYPQFRTPGDVHIHFFGTMKLSFGNRSAFQDDDKIEIHFDSMGADLVNYVRRIPTDSAPVIIQKG